MKRLAVLVSGNGSNLQAILDACASGSVNAHVVAVVSDKPDAFALTRATDSKVEFVCAHTKKPGGDRRAWDESLADLVASRKPDLVVLAGFMRILSNSFLNRFPGRVINLHPALPGELPGLHAIERAYREFTLGCRSGSGAMVHLVPDEGIDSGPVLGSVTVALSAGDTLESFAERMHAAEHNLRVSILSRLADEVSP